MSNITIYQGQQIIFTDTTSGGTPPYQYSWQFSGGTPSSATGATASVTYASAGDYNVRLDVTDNAGVNSYLLQSGLVTVNPAIMNANFSRLYTSRLMSQVNEFYDTSTGSPNDPVAWAWFVGTDVFTTQNVTGFQYDDWVDVPGASPLDPPGTTRTVTVQLTAIASSPTAFDTVSKTYTVSKIGPIENYYINANYPIIPLTSYTEESPVYSTTYRTSAIGLSPDEAIMSIKPGASGSGIQPIKFFHSTQEDVKIRCTGMATIGTSMYSKGWGDITDCFTCLNPPLYGGTVPTVASGNYILGYGSVDTIFFSVGPFVTNLIDNYGYTEDLVAEIIGSRYPIMHSAQLVTIISRGFPGTNFTYTGLSGNDPVVYSTLFFTNRGFSGTSYEITFNYSLASGSTGSFTVTMNGNSGIGNAPGTAGEFYSMQDVGPDLGVASQLNSAFVSNFPGGTGDIEAVALSRFNVDSGGDPFNFYGLKLLIKSTDINKLEIDDNSAALTALLSGNPKILPFAGTVSAAATCSGCLKVVNDLVSYQLTGSQVQIGGSIF
jgi:hypothetical protein